MENIPTFKILYKIPLLFAIIFIFANIHNFGCSANLNSCTNQKRLHVHLYMYDKNECNADMVVQIVGLHRFAIQLQGNVA